MTSRHRIMHEQFSGLVAAPFTPFHADGQLNLEPIPRLARLLAANRIRAAFVCGTTGEGSSLTLEERRRVAEAWRAALPPGVALIVHVGCPSMGESCELARHAQAIGADSIATIAPHFFKPTGADALVAWCKPIAAGAPRLPFYYYHMPGMTGVRVSASAFIATAIGQIPTLAGIKFTDEDLDDYAQARELGKNRYSLLFGRDEILLSGLERGAIGAVGSTYNYAAPIYHRIMRAFAAGDLEAARRDQQRVREFIDIMNQSGGLPAGKAIMRFIGFDCGPVRLPLTPLEPGHESVFHNRLTEIGFFDYASRI